MEISTKQYKHCDLVTVKGRIDSATAPQLSETLDGINESGRFKIVLDMDGVEFMSSAGLRVLVSTQKVCKRYNRGELSLACVPERVYEALDLVGFVKLFSFHDDVLEAVGSF